MSRRRPAAATIAAALVVLAAASVHAEAREVVRFVDGRYLEIDRHEVHGPIVRLTVEPGAVLVFGAERVEWIERAGLRVFGPDPVEPRSSVVARRIGREPDGAPSEPAAARPHPREVARDFTARPVRGRRPTR